METTPALRGKTTIILTADHGGIGGGHGDAINPAVYTIPFYVWRPHILPGKEFHALNAATRSDPGKNRLSCAASRQPIRHADGATTTAAAMKFEVSPGRISQIRQELKQAWQRFQGEQPVPAVA